MNLSKEQALNIYHSLLKIRKVELKIEDLYHDDEMKTPVHLSLGQEAVSAAICANLKREDYIFSNHRSHGHYLAKGGDLKAMIAEFYCKETGCAKGRGGSMHLIDTSVGHLGSSAIVGGGIPNAVGAAFAIKMQKKDLVAVTFFGDAACEQGVLYESMNWAKLHSLPIIYVCENNRYSVHSYIDVRQIPGDVSIRSKSFNIPSMTIDGMNAVEVYEKSQEAIEHARSGKGPYFLECQVQRWRAHAGAGDPIKEKYRKPQDLDESNVRDPLEEFTAYLMGQIPGARPELEKMGKDLDREIEEAFTFAQESPLPDDTELGKYIYS